MTVATALVAILVGTIGMTDEAYTPAGGDAARYLMNGVYIHDLFVDRPLASWSQLLEYTHLYYARYPALSVGHHPVLLAVLEAPVFALFGISIGAARLVPLAFLVVSVLSLQALVHRRYGPLAALFAGLLFITSPMVVVSTRSVMAEMPAIGLVLLSACLLERFAATDRFAALLGCAGSLVLSVYAKPQVALLVPALALSLFLAVPARRLLRARVLVLAIVTGLLSAPAFIVPLMLSPMNADGLRVAMHFDSTTSLTNLLRAAVEPQLAWPVVLLAVAAALRAAVNRDRRAVLFILSVVCVSPALNLFGGANAEAGARYTIYWVPGLCALAASMVSGWRTSAVKGAAATLLASSLIVQTTATRTIRDGITGAGGLEEAARFVLAGDPGPTVLYSGDVDTGYFTFFVRKHDPARRLVVLRADKLLTTSRMARPSIEDRIEDPEEIYGILQRFGTRYVVIEDRPSLSRVLEWLRQELHSPRFIERRRIPIGSSDYRLRDTSLAIFELRDPSPPDRTAVLSMRMPIVEQSLSVMLQDLLDRKLLR